MKGEKPILLIEDNLDDADLTIRAFRKNGWHHDFIVLQDGMEAMDFLFHREHVPPVLVLLDLKLPLVDGFELLEKIRAEKSTKMLPVVVFSSSREERDVKEAYCRGANGYVCKPINFSEFTEAIRILGQYWLHLNEPPPLP